MATICKYGLCSFIVVMFLWQCSKNERAKTIIQPVAISGTNVSLSPPPGFRLATDIPGFRHDSLLSSILVLETPKAYNHIMSEVSKEKLEDQDVKLVSIDTITIDGFKGSIYKCSSPSDGFSQWILVLQVEGHTVMVNGTFSEDDDAALSSGIRDALLSTRIIDKNDKLDFKVDSASLRVAKILAGPSVIFTKDGNWTDSSIFALSFFAGPFNLSETPIRLEEFALNQLNSVCADCEVANDGIHTVTIDGLDGYEVVAHSKDSSGLVKRLKYEVVLFDSLRYYLLVGTSSENSNNHLGMFKDISRSFRRAN